MLVRMDNASAAAALEGFSRVLNGIPEPMRKTLTYDQGKEMSEHKQLSERTGVAVFFADPHSPWQRGSNENTKTVLHSVLETALSSDGARATAVWLQYTSGSLIVESASATISGNTVTWHPTSACHARIPHLTLKRPEFA